MLVAYEGVGAVSELIGTKVQLLLAPYWGAAVGAAVQDPALPGAPWHCRMSWAAAAEGSKPRGNPPPPVCRGGGGDSRLQSPPHPPVLRNGPTGILPGRAGLAGSVL